MLGHSISDEDKPGAPEVLIEFQNGRGWVVMADPGGNEFCVERGELDPVEDRVED
ncbi:hypothetical protein [Streptomyces afghaniensis]|uniref:hypothetical protein n=1 Tax=Streptomyces afghaniensis TaxID=66865 RepID=UPI0027834E47|nr:hypothetical protein [Streptomyces afghaniensis]MDQ1019242.1 hypothetical protein [Streptomyces afghaniensis]